MSVRFYENNIAIVCPPDLYLYHDYVGEKRKRHWETNSNLESLQKASADRVDMILQGYMKDKWSIQENTFTRFEVDYMS